VIVVDLREVYPRLFNNGAKLHFFDGGIIDKSIVLQTKCKQA
jgi:hypothetical protein